MAFTNTVNRTDDTSYLFLAMFVTVDTLLLNFVLFCFVDSQVYFDVVYLHCLMWFIIYRSFVVLVCTL